MGTEEGTMKLTAQEIELFRHNGFVKLPSRLPKERVEALKEAALKEIRDEVEPVSRQDGRVIRISNVWGRGGVFRETIECDEILEPAESILGPNIEFMVYRHIHVYLRDRGSKASLELHRDCRQWSRPILTVMVYLEETHLENGCTRIVPGSHHLPAFSNVAEIREREEFLEMVEKQSLPLPMPAGGLLAMDGLMLHGAGENRTDRTRMSMTLGYHSVDEFNRKDDGTRVLMRGERAYGGNDRSRM